MTTVSVPLCQLRISPANVRRTTSKTELDELKASILAHGLLNNLVVTENRKGTYDVVAGGRRLSALQALVAEGKLTDTAIPCQIAEAGAAVELSLAENTVRVAMHPADEFEAFNQLIVAGATAEQIAHRFGKPEKHVLQRMKLARVAPALLKAYRAGEMKLDALEAFAITDDHKRQVKAWKEIEGWQRGNAREIRARLTDKMVDRDNRLARFVGLDAYEAAGGKTRADLFGDTVYLEDAALLAKLAGEKFDAAVTALKAEDWSWVNADIEKTWDDFSYAHQRIEGEPTKVPAELVKRHETLTKKAEAAQAALDMADDDDGEMFNAAWAADKALEACERELEGYRAFTPEQKAKAGAYAYIDRDGELCISRGLVKRADAKKGKNSSGDADGSDAPEKPSMSATLKADLEGYRQQVAQAAIASNRAIAFDLMAFTVAVKCLSHGAYDGPQISFTQQFPTPTVREAKTESAEALDAFRNGLPLAWLKKKTESEQFAAFRELTRDEKDRILAYCTALTLKPQMHTPGAFEDALTLTGVSVADYWRPTADSYLSRVTKDQLLAIGRTIAVTGDEWVGIMADSKKGVIAAELDRMFKKPVTDAAKAWLPEGMAFAAAPEVKRAGKRRAA